MPLYLTNFLYMWINSIEVPVRANLYYIITHRFSAFPPLKTKCFDGSHIVGVRKECTSQGPACEKKEANHPLSEKVIFVVRRRVLYSIEEVP